MVQSRRYLNSRFDVDSAGGGRFEIRLSPDGLLRIFDPKEAGAIKATIFVDDWLRIAAAVKDIEVKR